MTVYCRTRVLRALLKGPVVIGFKPVMTVQSLRGASQFFLFWICASRSSFRIYFSAICWLEVSIPDLQRLVLKPMLQFWLMDPIWWPRRGTLISMWRISVLSFSGCQVLIKFPHKRIKDVRLLETRNPYVAIYESLWCQTCVWEKWTECLGIRVGKIH